MQLRGASVFLTHFLSNYRVTRELNSLMSGHGAEKVNSRIQYVKSSQLKNKFAKVD